MTEFEKSELKNSIELHLLTATGHGWVKSSELCDLFCITERQLRSVNNHPGLCSEFAISGDKGFKHVTKAGPKEYIRFKHRMRRHAVSELIRVRALDRLRSSQTKTLKHPSFTYQKESGQGVLL